MFVGEESPKKDGVALWGTELSIFILREFDQILNHIFLG